MDSDSTSDDDHLRKVSRRTARATTTIGAVVDVAIDSHRSVGCVDDVLSGNARGGIDSDIRGTTILDTTCG